jgi:hypothetical protein
LQAHGEVLQGWAAAQLRLAASQASRSSTTAAVSGGDDAVADGSGDDTWRPLDTFLAANWQMYEEFAADILHKVSCQVVVEIGIVLVAWVAVLG